ncbi:fumarate hydratase, partial [Bacillus pseudomycoides]|uniref:fumarate hydratase C-terminal domain-containing protein n=1 Tax=Bacillus pseudomycoides TaxID=64104 RepID=UPI00284F27BB
HTKSEQRRIVLQAPITEVQICERRVRDVVTISGRMYSGRAAIHRHLMDNDCPVDLNGKIIYHCGPVVVKDENDNWEIKAAGPTTSIR